MTTDRTTIRRRLAVGSWPHRPPGGTRKGRHRTIVAPLAATLATSIAIGFGLALARSGVGRRARRSGPKNRGLGLQPGEQAGAGLRRQALEQADVVLGQLASSDGDARRAVHESRKAIKRLRTIVRLLEGELGSGSCATEQERLRAATALLAPARDAEVLHETLESLMRRHPKRLAAKAGVLRLRLTLARERDEAERAVLAPANLLRAGDEIRRFRASAEQWQPAESKNLGAIERGLRRIYRQGRRRRRRAAGKHGGRMRTMHQWRKRVKDLRYAVETLQRQPMPAAARHGSKASERAQAKWLRRLGRRADQLGELLGEEHDLAVLGAWISSHGDAAGTGRASRRRLLKLIARRRRKLRRRALRDGRELYRRKPQRFARRVRKAYRRSSPALSRR